MWENHLFSGNSDETNAKSSWLTKRFHRLKICRGELAAGQEGQSPSHRDGRSPAQNLHWPAINLNRFALPQASTSVMTLRNGVGVNPGNNSPKRAFDNA